jgi:PAS domain S-box-containing protein
MESHRSVQYTWLLKKDLFLLVVCGILGSAAAYLSINIPHTELFLEVRWLFGFMGFVLIRRLPLALVLPVLLSLAGFHQVPLYVALLGNLLYSLPFCFLLRFLYKRLLITLDSTLLVAVLWFTAVMAGYQLFTSPLIWFVIGILNGSLSLPFVLEVYGIQPYLEESLAVALISAMGLSISRMYFALRYRERHLSTILHSIGDGVIVTDNTGRIEMINPVAEDLTGWKKEEAENAELQKVFHIVDAETGIECENPVTKVLEKGLIVGLANHTMLISRGGEKYQIADSAAPIFDDEGPIKGVVLVFRDVTEDYAIRDQIEKELQEKAVLLNEVHHRVKNNLQIISSLLNLQSDSVADTHVKGVLDDSKNRIYSMALVHNQLYQSGVFTEIDFSDYCTSLYRELLLVFQKSTEVSVRVDIEDVKLELQTAIPCGLILNELITNSLKHAFTKKRPGRIEITLRLNEVDAMYVLQYKDNGDGLPENNRSDEADGLGLFLVKNLVEQINGSIERSPAVEGLHYRIRFPAS